MLRFDHSRHGERGTLTVSQGRWTVTTRLAPRPMASPVATIVGLGQDRGHAKGLPAAVGTGGCASPKPTEDVPRSEELVWSCCLCLVCGSRRRTQSWRAGSVRRAICSLRCGTRRP